jgi:hypothetical protein
VATLSVASVAVMACLLLGEARQAVTHADALISQETSDLHGSAQNLNAVLIQLGLTSDEARRAATEQRAYWNTLGKLSVDFVQRTDHNINDQLLPAASLLLTTTADNEQTLTVAANATLDAGSASLDTLRTRLNDPRIDEILGNIQSTTYEFAGTSADFHYEVHKLVFPPPRKWYQKWLLDPLKFAAHVVTIPISSF